MFLAGRFTAPEAMNAPTCLLSKAKHTELGGQGLTDSTPDVYWFFRRYQDLGVVIETRDGDVIDLATWNLDQHYEYFSG
jgi:hypothetical protein